MNHFIVWWSNMMSPSTEGDSKSFLKKPFICALFEDANVVVMMSLSSQGQRENAAERSLPDAKSFTHATPRHFYEPTKK
jgi:hypothetical protein